MGLATWKQALDGKCLNTDVNVAKNYLDQKETHALNRLVGMYFDYAEDQAECGNSMIMSEWKENIDAFLQFNDSEILDNLGKVSMEIAKWLAW